jgi:hypothetical protein
MPRPKEGYVNRAGQQVPGTHDPISRYMDKTALMAWAHKRGMRGMPLYARDAIDIGGAVHAMADLDLKGRPDREIESVAREAGLARDDYDKAMRAFMQFRKWRVNCQVQPIALELSLVSELHQYGGTPDCVALISGKVSLVEFKTSVKPFADHLVAMAAHAQLWTEFRPGQPIEHFHWLGCPKDGSEFQHHSYADLSPQWEIFTLYLDAWRLEKGLQRRRTAKVSPEPMPLKDALEASVATLKSCRRTTRAKVKQVADFPEATMATTRPVSDHVADAIAQERALPKTPFRPELGLRPQTMAEILRANGLVPALS